MSFCILLTLEEHTPERNLQIGDPKLLLEVPEYDLALAGMRALSQTQELTRLLDCAIVMLGEAWEKRKPRNQESTGHGGQSNIAEGDCAE